MMPGAERSAGARPGASWRTPADLARRRAFLPVEARALLDRWALASSHRRLAAALAPGLRVLDIGCGTGAITRGIAERVAPGGRVVGLDVSDALVAAARQRHAGVPGLSFVVGDVYDLPANGTFDIVTAARVLQWLDDPLAALRAMRGAARPGTGRIVVLDSNHEKIAWRPTPPATVQEFYASFLAWRADAGMDNAIADHLPELFVKANLTDVVVTPEHETSRKCDPDFDARAGIWAEVAATRGHQMVADGVLEESARARAEQDYRAWLHEVAEEQVMYLLAVEGTRPAEARR